MSLKRFFQRQKARVDYLVERIALAVEDAAEEGGVLPKLPPKKKDRQRKETK